MTTYNPISVDDHVVEPAHVFVDHIDPKFRDRAPRIVERDGAQGWLWEDRFYPLLFQGNAQTRKFREGESRTRRRPLRAPLRRHDPGRVRRARARPGDGRRRRVGRAAVPDVPALRRQPQFLASRRQGPRARDGAGVERLDARRVVRGVPRALHPADAHPAVGRAGGRRRDRALRRRRARGRCCSSRTRTRSACRRSRPGTGVRCSRRATTPGCRCRCTSARRWACIKPSPETTPSVGIALCGINSMSALGDLIFSGTFNGLPNCRVALSEGGAGWVPYVLERLDYTWERSRYEGLREHDAPPSEVFARAHLGVHDLRPVRDPEPRPDRRRQDHVGGRLPAQRLELAEQPQDARRRAASTSPTTKRSASPNSTPASSTASRARAFPRSPD